MGESTTLIEVASNFFNTVFGTKPEHFFLLIWNKNGKESKWFRRIDEAAKYVINTAQIPLNDLYVGASLSTESYGAKQRVKNDNAAAIGGFWLDIDFLHEVHKKKNLPPTVEDAVTLAQSAPIKPTSIIHTGHGIQAWWALDKVWVFQNDEERREASRLIQIWQGFFKMRAAEKGWDIDSTFDLSRIYRIPGTYNYKQINCPKQVTQLDFNPQNCLTLNESIDVISNLSPVEGQRFFKAETEAQAVRYDNGSCGQKWEVDFTLNPNADVSGLKLEALLDLDPKIRRTWDRKRKDFQDQSASAYDFALANYAIQYDWNAQETVDLLIVSGGDTMKI